MRGAARLPYCGTCKTLGAIYGHQTRALLNHDTVFLAELLQCISKEQEWSQEYRSFNCLILPQRTEIPVALEFAAAATVVLAHFKIADHQADSNNRLWGLTQNLLSPSYRRAIGSLRRWRFPVDELTEILTSQRRLEEEAESLRQVAEPTAAATAMFFSHGARLVERGDLFERMYQIGHLFGFLAYTLDAYEDRNLDARNGAFNPLLRFARVDGMQEVLQTMRELETELPSEFALRLRRNVEERLELRETVRRHKCRAGIRERWSKARKFAETIRAGETAGAVPGILVFASAAIVAFFFPHHVRGAESWRQCMGLIMNLMAWATVWASSPNLSPSLQEKPSTPKSSQSKGSLCGGCDCDSCDCDGCDGCDCS